MDMAKYRELFISETSEHLQSLDENLSALQKDADNAEAIASCFRNAHSIKGMAASMSYEPMRDLAHKMEDLLDDFRQGLRQVEQDSLDVMFEGVDLLEKMLQQVEQEVPVSIDFDNLSKRIDALREGAQADRQEEEKVAQEDSMPPDEASEEAKPGQTTGANYTLRAVLAHETPAPGVRGFLIYKRMQDMGRVISSRPDIEDIRSGKFLEDRNGLAMEIDIITESSQSEIVKTINSLAEVQSFEIHEYRGAEKEAAVVGKEEVGDVSAAAADPFAASTLPQTVRVRTRELDRFINTLGEMILIKSELKEISRKHAVPGLSHGLDKLERIVKDFHDQVMEIRLMPLEAVTGRLPKAVRELARDENKRVRFDIIGKDIELDRAILEQLTDPLLHLLRNSVSHGIEPPEEREKAGKNPTGSITLEAYRQRDMVLLEVRDDGRGMDPFEIREVALSKGFLKPEDAETITDEETLQLVFLPGFSSAQQVDMVSGRGVGMDAVRNVVESMGGFVTLASDINRGSTITLHLPRTIAIVNVLLIRLEKEIFAIPITKIQKTVEILTQNVKQSQKQKYYIERQELIPLLELHKFLDMPVPENNNYPKPALLVEVQKRKLALLVDELIGQEEAFIRPLGKPLERISGLAGSTMLGDGSIVFVLDTLGLV